MKIFGRELGDVLKDHELWIEDMSIGERAILCDVDLNKVDLSGVNLSWADLTGAKLSKANLSGVDLIKTNLCDVDLSEACLNKANLSKANLSEAELSKADFGRANLKEADLSGSNLDGADFSGANLVGANLSKAELSGVVLCQADLEGANLSEANLNNANLTGANLSNVDLSNAWLARANFTGADLVRAKLTKVNFTDANLMKTNLTEANLCEARLENIKFDETTVFQQAKIDLKTYVLSNWKLETLKELRKAGVILCEQCEKLLQQKEQIFEIPVRPELLVAYIRFTRRVIGLVADISPTKIRVEVYKKKQSIELVFHDSEQVQNVITILISMSYFGYQWHEKVNELANRMAALAGSNSSLITAVEIREEIMAVISGLRSKTEPLFDTQQEVIVEFNKCFQKFTTKLFYRDKAISNSPVTAEFFLQCISSGFEGL